MEVEVDMKQPGFCDEKEAEVYCANCCPKWKRNTEMDEVSECTNTE